MIALQKFSIIFFLLLCIAQGSAQTGSEKVKSDIDSFSKYLDKDLDIAHKYIQRGYANSIVLKNDSLLARTSYNLCYYHYLKNNVDSSKIYLKKGFEFARKSNFKKIVSLCYNQAGTIAVDENQFEKALKWYQLALDIAEKNNLYKNKSCVLINLGNLSVRQKDTLKALEYYRQDIANAIKYSLDNELISGYSNTAILYASSNKNRAANYYKKALVIAQKNKNVYAEFNLHINFSDLYVRYKSESALKQVYYHL